MPSDKERPNRRRRGGGCVLEKQVNRNSFRELAGGGGIVVPA